MARSQAFVTRRATYASSTRSQVDVPIERYAEPRVRLVPRRRATSEEDSQIQPSCEFPKERSLILDRMRCHNGYAHEIT